MNYDVPPTGIIENILDAGEKQLRNVRDVSSGPAADSRAFGPNGMLQTIVCVDLDGLRPDSEQLARHRDPEKRAGLRDSIIRYGVLEPLGMRPDGSLLWGHGRYLAAREAGLKQVPVIVTDRVLSETEIECIKAIENAHSEALVDQDLYRTVAKLKKLNPDATQQAIGEMIGLNGPKMTRLFAVDKVIPAVKEAFLGGALGLGKTYEISKAPGEREQHEFLRLALGNECSRDQLARRVGRKANGSTGKPADKISKAKFVIQGGAASVTVANGGKLGMEELIDYLQDLTRSAKAARDKGIGIRNFAAVLREQAKTEGVK